MLALDVVNKIITLEFHIFLSSEAVVECRGEMKQCYDIYINNTYMHTLCEGDVLSVGKLMTGRAQLFRVYSFTEILTARGNCKL